MKPQKIDAVQPPVVRLYNVQWAETAVGAGQIMDNVRMCGIEEVKATWDKDAEMYRVEYLVPRRLVE